MDAGEIIFKSFVPTLKIIIGISVGYAIAKAGLFNPQMAKGVGINISLPALIFASMVPSFTPTNISAFGGLTLAAVLYMVAGAAMAWIVKEIFYVPLDFQWGIIVLGAISNWINVPVPVVQSVGDEPPFRQGDVDIGISYIAVLTLIQLVILFPCGLHKVLALDFRPEVLARAKPPSAAERWKVRIATVRRLAHPRPHPTQEKEKTTTDLNLEAVGHDSTSQSSTSASTLVLPQPPSHCDLESGQASDNPRSGQTESALLPISDPSFSVGPPIPPAGKPTLFARLISILSSFLMPVSVAVIISLPCALIQPLRALFTPTEGWSGTRMPNAPDGRPPLAFILETAAFIGAICIPAGLILLGASFARLKGVWSLKGQPVAAILAMVIGKMIVLPVIGTFFITSQSGIYPPEDRMRAFVCILVSGSPASVNQLVLTQLYNRGGTAHTLARFLLLQYLLMPILCTALAAVALWISGR